MAAATDATTQDTELQDLLTPVPENPEVDELIYFIPEKYVVVQKLSRSAYRIKGKAMICCETQFTVSWQPTRAAKHFNIQIESDLGAKEVDRSAAGHIQTRDGGPHREDERPATYRHGTP